MDNSDHKTVYGAIHDGDLHLLNSCIDQGFDVFRVTESERWTLLHRAVDLTGTQPKCNIVRRLIDLGLDVNAVDARGWTPLHFAARRRHEPSCRLLLEAGAEVDPLDANGITPLHRSLLSLPVDHDTVETFLEFGASETPKLKSFLEAVAIPEAQDWLDRLGTS